MYSRETYTKQNQVDQNFTMTQQLSSVPPAWIHGWVYFSSLLSAGCANKSAQIIPAAVLPSYASVRSNPDRAVSVTGLIITIIIIMSVEPKIWVRSCCNQEVSGGLVRGALDRWSEEPLLVELQEADGLLSKVPGKVPSRPSFSLALNSMKTWWTNSLQLHSPAVSSHPSKTVTSHHITSPPDASELCFPVEVALSLPSKVPLKELKLVHTASKCHFIHTAEYLSTMNSVQEFHAPLIRLRSDCTESLAETREHRNSSSGRRHKKKTKKQTTSRCLKKPLENTASTTQQPFPYFI